jgi:hypothetical protein
MPSSPPSTGIDLYWLPLGAGGHSVRLNGKVFEAVAAWLGSRERCDLYHSALQVYAPEVRFVIEQAPVWREDEEHGVVGEGAVGVRAFARLPLFRYEIRRWREGLIPDVDEAVESPQRLSDDPDCARRLLELVPEVPTPVWGRDELRAGEMWNSNSTISWLIARSGLDVESIRLPRGGRAPGWHAGIVVARRQQEERAHSQLAATALTDVDARLPATPSARSTSVASSMLQPSEQTMNAQALPQRTRANRRRARRRPASVGLGFGDRFEAFRGGSGSFKGRVRPGKKSAELQVKGATKRRSNTS